MTDIDKMCFSCPLPTCYDEDGTPAALVAELRKLCPLEQAEKVLKRKRVGNWRAIPSGYLTVRDAAARLGLGATNGWRMVHQAQAAGRSDSA